MSLEKQIELARRKVVTDGYDMSVGELVSMYKSEELIIDPEYQRLFRWEDQQRTKFIESILLGIPTPPLFVSAMSSGKWELVDGLQRVSTILQFTGELKTSPKTLPLTLDGTELIPALSGIHWEKNNASDLTALPENLKLEFKRQRIRVEILKAGSDPETKYELFQRLNTGGTKLSEQEVRNCVLVMIDRPFYKWLSSLAAHEEFLRVVDITEAKLESKYQMELVLRYLALRHVKYTPGRDVHDYLDEAARILPKLLKDRRSEETALFESVFGAFEQVFGRLSFRTQNKPGALSLAAFETLSVGASFLIEKTNRKPEQIEIAIRKSAQQFWKNPAFKKYSGMGVRGSDRMGNLGSRASEFVSF